MAVHTRRHTDDMAQPVTSGVYAIARYKLIDHRRRPRAELADVPVEDAGELVARDVERLHTRLPRTMRQAVRFMKVEGLSAAEAAERSGMSEPAIKVSVQRGLNAMATFAGAKRK
ncbi:sigma factor-like helix-turn-helix DNA-binding protein [Methylobacterium sp. 092160098-2]|nr:sigma factor-like helix-turn-helix DNA-binding protein [Methylobacterium sp. 092160098-2]MDE4915974.1 sigma factor-like helix-turn-helix DNA-binding protein [Methylobacterium sp. 092160098-2]